MRRAATIVMLVLGAALTACTTDDPPKTGTARTTPASTEPTSASPAPTGPAATASGGPAAMLPGRHQPLWPFADAAQVRTWQRSYRTAGTAAWHLDAERTALRFTRDHLGFTEIDRVTSRDVKGRDAHIGVGYRTEGSRTGTAAVLHLIRTGEGGDAPWEVVGSDDTTLQVLSPAYASRVTSPMTVGGRITGVDESVRVTVLGVGSTEPVGEYCCVTAGGEDSPWSAKVAFEPGGGVLTVVVSTGGHLKEVERFALTGVRP
ncbi:hypothetical protein [Actinocorallia herbida]|nr:hypothetical protein [Actinocorallia herbida]